MSVHVLLTHHLWRRLNADHDNVYLYFEEHGIRLSYVIVDNWIHDYTITFKDYKQKLLFEIKYGEYLT